MSAATASRRAVVALALAVGALVLGAGGAQAHSTLLSSDPADGSTVAVAPPRVTLTFNEPARSLGTEVVVAASDGSAVASGDPVVDGSTVSQDLAGPLPAGTYTVTWRVTSADGHPLEGVLSFTASATAPVGGDPVVVAPPAASPPPAPTAAATPTPATTPTPTPTDPVGPTAAPTGAASAPPVIGPLVVGRTTDDDGTRAVVLAAAAVVVGLVAAGAVLHRRRRRAPGSRSAGS